MEDKYSLSNRVFSYWEKDILSQQCDFNIIGGGLVGLSTAISLRELYPSSSIRILERSNIPYGASTRNAGFACFGSISEIIDDLKSMTESEVEEIIYQRWAGLNILKSRVGEKNLQFLQLGGYEIFLDKNQNSFSTCKNRIDEINKLINRTIGLTNCFRLKENEFGISCNQELIYNKYEGQIHPGRMMEHLTKTALSKNVDILYGVNISSYEEQSNEVKLFVQNHNLLLSCNNLILTTNAFTRDLVDNLDISPGRNQVLLTKPIKNLPIKGCFHYDKGYVYFRNYENRLLIGGGRNIAELHETTTEFGLTDQIRCYIRSLLDETILTNTHYEEDMWWSGIIATGDSKMPIVKALSDKVYLGVRLGGMGVALGSMVGDKLAKMV